MNSESKHLAWAGAALGLMVLSAGLFARSRPPARPPETGTGAALVELTADFEAEAAAVLAQETQAGPFELELAVPDGGAAERAFLCDGSGCPLEEIEPDAGGTARLGPLAPGLYSVCRGSRELGRFRLSPEGTPAETAGQLWTDGTRLWLARSPVGTARFRLSLPGPGYWSFQLWDRDGRSRSRDLYIPEGEPPEAGGGYRRSLDFPGLAPGLYTLARAGRPLLQLTVRAGETAAGEVNVEN